MNTNFHILQTIPPEWFEFKNNKWYARTHLANSTSLQERKDLDKTELIECDIIMFSLYTNEIIPVNIYDEHQNGRALLKSVYNKYGVNSEDYYPLFLNGSNAPCTQEDVEKMKIIFKKLLDSNIDLSNTEVYIGYLTRKYDSAEISVEEFLNNNYGSDIIEKPLTDVGIQFVEVFETFRDSFSKRINGKFPKQKLKTTLKNIHKLMKKYGFSNNEEYEDICNVIDLYYEDVISEEELETKLFGFDGYRNVIHNRIRNKIDDEEFEKLVGNPIMLNNIMDCM